MIIHFQSSLTNFSLTDQKCAMRNRNVFVQQMLKYDYVIQDDDNSFKNVFANSVHV